MSDEIKQGKVCLVMMDAIGINEDDERNAVKAANMEFLNSLKTDENCAYYELEANGMKVGLPDGKIGNNGVGILVIASGKRQYRNLVRINNALEDGSFQSNEVLNTVFRDTVDGNGRIHFVGCITDSHEEAEMGHLYALLKFAKQFGVENAYIHGILDGEDVPTGHGLELTKELEDWIADNEYGTIGSLCGRRGILDIKDSLEEIKTYFQMLMNGNNLTEILPSDYIQLRYDLEEDSTIAPALLNADAQLKDGDHVVLFNVRTASSSIIMHCFADCDTTLTLSEESQKIIKALTFLENTPKPDIHVASLVQYDESMEAPVLFPPSPVDTTFVRVLGENGKKQLRVAEECRFTHLKFLLNGAGDFDIKGDDTIMVHDASGPKHKQTLITAMEATANLVCNACRSQYYDQISTVLAAAGLAAPTRDMDLTVEMCKAVDASLKTIVSCARENGYTAVVVGTSCEAAYVKKEESEEGRCFNVPCIVAPPMGEKVEKKEMEWYSLENVAATCLKTVGVEPASHMAPALI